MPEFASWRKRQNNDYQQLGNFFNEINKNSNNCYLDILRKIFQHRIKRYETKVIIKVGIALIYTSQYNVTSHTKKERII